MTKVLANKHIRKGDKVVVISGNDRGQTGNVLRRTAERAVVQGINVRKKHVKKSEASPKGGLVAIERSIHLSKLMLVNDAGKGVKARVRIDKEGNRELIHREDGKEKVLRSIKKSK